MFLIPCVESQALLPEGVGVEEVFSKQDVSSVFTLGYPPIGPWQHPSPSSSLFTVTYTAGGATFADLQGETEDTLEQQQH